MDDKTLYSKLMEQFKTLDKERVKGFFSNRFVQLGVAFLAGMLLCTFVYPTKKIEERVQQEYQQIIDRKVQEQRDITTAVTKQRDELSSKMVQLESQYQSRVSELSSKLKEMSSKRVETTHKITRPDGSSEEWTYLETESKTTETIISQIKFDYEQRIRQTESDITQKKDLEIAKTKEQYESKVTEMTKTIAKLEQEKITTVNEKKFAVEVGATTELRGYVHSTYDLWGPIFVGGHIEGNKTDVSGGLGVGVRF